MPPSLSPEELARPLVVQQWGMAMDPRRGKEIHCLHDKIFTVQTALDEFGKQLQRLPTHNFKMFKQWEALARAKAALKPYELITEEDYQVGPVPYLVYRTVYCTV